MKNKDLIALLQRFDPEADIVTNVSDYCGPKFYPVSTARRMDVVERNEAGTGTYYREAVDGNSVEVIEIV